MRVFVTGATGFIGVEVVRLLLAGGDEVVGLARSDRSASTLRELGASALRGDLRDHDSLAAGARENDGVIHLGFTNDYAKLHEWGEVDRRTLEAIVQALRGSGKPLVSTSVIAVLESGRLACEEHPPAPGAIGSFREPSESVTLAAQHHNVRSTVVRLPPTVHGAGDKVFVPAMIELARRSGFSAYPDFAEARWPAVHRLDAARLFVLALKEGTPGGRFHAVAEEEVPVRAIAQVIARKLNVPTRGLSEVEIGPHFGWLAKFVTMDLPASSAATRMELSWSPREIGLLTDIEQTYPDPAVDPRRHK